jgi:hypothetical protein
MFAPRAGWKRLFYRKPTSLRFRLRGDKVRTPCPPWRCYSATTIGIIERNWDLRCYKRCYKDATEVLQKGVYPHTK